MITGAAVLSAPGFLQAPLALALDPTKQLSQYQHSSWSVQDGSLPGIPYSMAQTRDGYIWIGTTNGLVRFDGVKFDSFATLSGEPTRTPRIPALLADRDGSLWIGTAADLEHWQNGMLSHLVPPNSNGFQTKDIVQADDGTIWIARNQNDDQAPICRVIGIALGCYGPGDGVGGLYARGLVQDTHGSLWFINPHSLGHWDPHERQALPGGIEQLPPLADPSALALTPDQLPLLSLNAGGVGLAVARAGKLEAFEVAGLDGRAIRAQDARYDSTGSLWIATNNRGIYRIRGTTTTHYSRADGLSNDSTGRIFEDREHNIWVLTSSGIDRFRDVIVSSFSTQEGLSAATVEGVEAARDGSMWIANGASIDILHLDGSIVTLRGGQELPGTIVRSLMQDHAGRMWLGFERGLYIYERQSLKAVPLPKPLSNSIIWGLRQQQNGDIWAITGDYATQNGSALRFDEDGRLQELIPFETLPLSQDGMMGFDADGAVWLPLMNDRLARLIAGKPEIFELHHKSGKPVDFTGLITAPGDFVVLGTGLFGLSIIHHGEVRSWSIEDGFPSAHIRAMVADQKAIWISADCGIIEVPFTQLERWWSNPAAGLHTRILNGLDGAQPTKAGASPAASVSADGRIWFAHESVLQVFDPKDLRNSPAPLPVNIERLAAGGRSYPGMNNAVLPPLTKDVQIDYTSPAFATPQRLRFKYKLEGLSNEWHEPTNRRQVSFSNLGPGNYRFHVSAASGESSWTQESGFKFRILPAFYQTVWFMWLCAAAGLCLLFIIYRIRVSAIKRSLRARLKVRMDERERIARDLHDTMFQNFQGLLLGFDNAANTLADSHPVRAAFKTLLQRSDEVMAESRVKVLELRVENADRQSISQALTELGDRFASGSGTEFHAFERGTARGLYPLVFEEVIHICREALSNASRHSGASRIEMEITFASEVFTVRIIDNGEGIKADILFAGGRKGHFGLRGMKERADKIGGKLTIRSRPRAGTEIELRVPKSMAYRSVHLGWFASMWKKRAPQDSDLAPL